MRHEARQVPSWLIFDVSQMIVGLVLYCGVGLGVLAFVCSRRAQPQVTEVGDWMLLLATSVYTWWLLIILWPLWLLMLCIPYSEPQQERRVSPAPEIPIGSIGTVVVPLVPLGRVDVAGAYRDARAKFGTIPMGASIVVVARGMSSELIVDEANKAPEPTPGSVTPRAIERESE